LFVVLVFGFVVVGCCCSRFFAQEANTLGWSEFVVDERFEHGFRAEWKKGIVMMGAVMKGS
jgi:hypothetical protein